MRVLICGADGYLGWPLLLHLENKGHEVYGLDNFSRRHLVKSVGSNSAIPIGERPFSLDGMDVVDWKAVGYTFRKIAPECVVYLAQMPSAPYSMRGRDEAVWTHNNNVIGHLNVLYAIQEFCPDAHLVKLGTMGEYGTPNCTIPEGTFPNRSRWGVDKYPDGPEPETENISGMLFPRRAGSWYHLTKVHDTHNLDFACRNWGLRATDIMQGVVYGTRTDEVNPTENPETATRFDFDSYFGTALNRFCAQAVIGHAITPYGRGEQKRGFLPLRDVMQCLRIAVENPPEPGEYRTWNQFDKAYSINQLAQMVKHVALDMDLQPRIRRIENPRNEAEDHEYEVVTDKLWSMGYKPTANLVGEVVDVLTDLLPHRQRIKDCEKVLLPDTRWDNTKRRSNYL